ncbi:MAG TPA: ROK family protein [Chloroflexota bacterium]|nr:ROK family protein [Chloroflexota bacterium]
MDGDAALAIDLGGTRIKAGIVVGHEVVLQRIVATEDEQGFERVLQHIIDVGDALLREHPASAVGLSLPAVVDVERGTVLDVRKNLLGLIGYPLVATLQQRFNLPVAIENDARLYGLGELVAGAARDVANVVCLTLGTGVGCCVAQDGHILRGTHGTGGILGGHMTIETYGPTCTCGNIGCVETFCSAPALVAAMAGRLATEPDHPLNAAQSLTPELIVAAARHGDVVARETLATYIRHLSAAVVSYIHVYDPDVVVIGGGIMHAADDILPPLQAYVLAHTWTSPPRPIPVRAAALGDQAALIGAAALARGQARFR